jgi:hypothetical protein
LSKVTSTVIGAIKAAEDYSRQSKQLTIDISGAEKATKGLVDTSTIMSSANKLNAAGINLTAKQFEKLNKFAASQAQVMGEKVEPAVNRFFKSLTSGRTTALKQFGIDLKESGTVSETFAGVMKHVEKNVGSATVKVELLGDRVFALENNLSTAASEVIDFAGTFEPLNVVMDETNKLLETFIADLRELKTLGGTMEGFIAEMVIGVSSAFGFGDSDFVKDLEAAQKAELVGGFVEQQSKRRDEKKKKKPKKPKKPKGPKRKIETDDKMTFVFDIISGEQVEEEELKEKIERQNALAIAGVDDLILTIDERMQQLQIKDRELSVVTLEQTNARLDQLGLLREEKWAQELEQADREKLIQEEKHIWLLENSREYAEEQKKIDDALFQSRIMDASSAFGDLAALQDVENRKAFKVGKAAALASAGLAGGIAVSQAFARGLEVPFVGWLLGPIYAAAAATQVGVQLANIAKMQYKGAGGTSAASAGTAPTTGAPAPELGTAQGTGSGERGPQIINVQLGADTLMSALINESKDRDRGGFETILLKAGA